MIGYCLSFVKLIIAPLHLQSVVLNVRAKEYIDKSDS